MSSFNGVDIFGSGPHRFYTTKQGILTVPDFAANGVQDAKSIVFGNIELDVWVRGRLVAASDSALWTIRNVITAYSVAGTTPHTLVDNNSKSFSTMTLVDYTEGDRTDRGRVWSTSYIAHFRHLT